MKTITSDTIARCKVFWDQPWIYFNIHVTLTYTYFSAIYTSVTCQCSTILIHWAITKPSSNHTDTLGHHQTLQQPYWYTGPSPNPPSTILIHWAITNPSSNHTGTLGHHQTLHQPYWYTGPSSNPPATILIHWAITKPSSNHTDTLGHHQTLQQPY